MKKQITAFALALALCLGLAVPVSAAGFSDVPASHWAYEQINRAVTDGIVGGYQVVIEVLPERPPPRSPTPPFP